MIHKLLVMDRDKGVGHELYESPDHTLEIATDLLISFIQALLMIGNEFGKSKGDLREVELGKYQISLLKEDHVVYVVIHDTYDSEPFTAKIIQNVVDKYHPQFVNMNFNLDVEQEEAVKEDIAQMLQTMKFPEELLEELQELTNEFLLDTNWMTDTLFVTDLDDGIIAIAAQPEEEDEIIIRLLEIMSEIPFERHWIGESKLFESKTFSDGLKDYEAWFIYRVGLTDFCVMGRAYLAAYAEREQLIQRLEELTQRISQMIMN